jgi:methylglutaconyl-CoA hydratase
MSDVDPQIVPHDPNAIAHPLSEEPTVVVDTSSVAMHATEQGVAFVTLNRPRKKNALDDETIEALRQAFDALAGEEGARMVVLRGAGGAFCAGADADWMRRAGTQSESDNRADAMNLARMLKALHDLPQLTVALVEGPAFGGGAGLVAACDLAVAAEGARFAFSEVKLGLTPATISPYVVAAIGARNARMLFASARVFGAAEAQRYGLVQEVLPDAAGFDGVVAELTQQIVSCAPGAVADAKRLVDHVAAHPLDHRLMEETARRIAARRASDEGREGLAAFLEKRRPAWHSRP